MNPSLWPKNNRGIISGTLILVSPLVFILLAIAVQAELVPFSMDYDDGSESPTSIAHWLHQPAGKYGFIQIDEEGHFIAGRDRIRIWGVNISSDNCYTNQSLTPGIARRLAKFGINAVRFHHMNASWMRGNNSVLIDYYKGNSLSFNDDKLDNLDYFFSELKKAGIYSNFNLLASRYFYPADGLPDAIAQLKWKEQHLFGFWDQTHRQLQKDYAYNLLTHLNRYTGLRYVDDPALAFVEILNENGLIHFWFDGLIDIYPPDLLTGLEDEWNAWLQDKYVSSSQVETSWNARREPFGNEMMVNGDFQSGTNGWNTEQHQGAVATFTTGTFESRQGICIEVTEPGSVDWHVQLNQGNHSFEKDRLYTLTFWAKASESISALGNISQAYNPWTSREVFNLELETDWQEYVFLWESNVTDSNLRLNFTGFGNQAVSVYLSDISILPGGELGTIAEGRSLEQGNVPIIFLSTPKTNNQERDWHDFLTWLEDDYYADMTGYIRNDLGYPGIIFGTIVGTSTPNIQAEMDVIDSHYYWQHPIFPRVQFDPDDWYINQLSVVNSPAENIGSIGMRRVKGKPFMCTEYQHPAPNIYSSEGPVIIGAYGALQDWDGIWLFDYGSGAYNWGSGKVDGWFDMQGHSPKMANMLIGAAMFMRGDVSRGIEEYTVAFDRQTELDTIVGRGSQWHVADAGLLSGVDNRTTLLSRFAMIIGQEAPETVNPPPAINGNVFSSDTGELLWDASVTDKGVVTVNTDRTKAVIGFINNRSWNLGGVAIDPGATMLDWATIGLSVMKGNGFNDPAGASIVMVTTGYTQNTNMGWTDDSKTTVNSNWGSAPVLVETIPATIDLPVAASRVQVWPLNPTGQRESAVTVTDNNGNARFTVGSAYNTLWYEIVIEAEGVATTPSDLRSGAVGPGLVWIDWEDGSYETQYIIERREPNGIWEEVGIVSQNTSRFFDSGLNWGITYQYRVKARNAVGDSAWSDVVSTRLLNFFEEWRQSRFDLGDPEQVEMASTLADPDGDGIPNLLEFALNGDPIASTNRGYLPIHTFVDVNGSQRLALQFARIIDNGGLLWRVQVSDDLINWINIDPDDPTFQYSAQVVDGQEVLTIHDTTDSGSQRYMRLWISEYDPSLDQ